MRLKLPAYLVSLYLLSSGGRYVLAEVRGGDDDLGLANIVILDEDNLEEVTDLLVLVDDGSDVVDEVDNLLSHPVARCSLSTKDGNAGLLLLSLFGRHGLEAKVSVNNTKNVELLALVFVNPLHLNIEESRRVDGDAIRGLDQFGKTDLVRVLDFSPFFSEGLIFEVKFELIDLGEVLEELAAATTLARDELGEARVRLVEPPAWGDAVRDVGEFVDAKNRDEVPENSCPDEIGVELGDAVDLVGTDNSEVSHAHHLGVRLLNNRNPPKEIAVIGEDLLDTLEEEEVYIINNLEMSREEMLEETDGPFFKRLWQHCVIGVAKLRHSMLIQCHRRMAIDN